MTVRSKCKLDNEQSLIGYAAFIGLKSDLFGSHSCGWFCRLFSRWFFAFHIPVFEAAIPVTGRRWKPCRDIGIDHVLK